MEHKSVNVLDRKNSILQTLEYYKSGQYSLNSAHDQIERIIADSIIDSNKHKPVQINYDKIFTIFDEVLGYKLLEGEFGDLLNELNNEGYFISKLR